ncbi:hypothetical protein HXX76_006157 [Chlamydomonas incerta]|uniref:O-fucosyltransferase family protein n=1 Tax=Chlamydomonas incerta TaxID=51695 RepID=A0A835T775_CHLIN|nr:hypothetical protein HXX76_006157 [Chlamydomonas incerta]|eukprot:KAG2437508.1 hypothetical protein HXX76_006157 [Chlamydomonas incerta]
MGVGNRVSGMLWMLRVAVAYQRVLVLQWHGPADLSNFMLPNEIDWTPAGLNMSLIEAPNDIAITFFFDAVYRADAAGQAKFNATRSLRHITNEHHYIKMAGVPDMADAMQTGACMFNFLFKPHPEVLRRANAHLTAVYGRVEVDYVAWHWRHGDADGGKEQPVLLSHLSRTLESARALAKTAGIDMDATPLLLITDFNIMRRMVVAGFFRGVATPNITARHIQSKTVAAVLDAEQARQADLNDYRDIFADLYLLSRARCMVFVPCTGCPQMSTSTFTCAALFWGGRRVQSCTRGMHTAADDVVAGGNA